MPLEQSIPAHGGIKLNACDKRGAGAVQKEFDIEGSNIGLTATGVIGVTVPTFNLVGGFLLQGNMLTTLPARLCPTTVAALPSPNPTGQRAFVTDSNTAVWGSVVAAGTPNHNVPVFSNGSAWIVG